MHRGSAPFVRLLLAALLAGAGAILVLVGLTSIVRPAPSATGSPGGSAPATAGASPSAVPSASVPTGTEPAGGSPTPIPAEVILLGAGDIGRCDGTDDERTAAMIEARDGIVFTLGDNAYERGSDAEYRDCFGPSWGRFKDRIQLPVPGNHEYGTSDAAGYRAYFGDAAVRDGTTWYSEDIGAWHLVVLDSTCGEVDGGCDADSPQVRWLREDLAASRARCTLALFHHPRFSSGEHGSDSNVAPFWDALYEADADLVLNGHEHDYERFAAQDPQGRSDDARGIMELIVGTGGAPLRAFRDPIDNSRVRAAVSHGIVELRLNQTGWSWQFDTTDAAFQDAGSGRCH
jgi:alkaline phosphatase